MGRSGSVAPIRRSLLKVRSVSVSAIPAKLANDGYIVPYPAARPELSVTQSATPVTVPANVRSVI
jgi:hypothetical protein